MSLSCISWDYHVISVLQSTYLINYIYWQCVEPPLHLTKKGTWLCWVIFSMCSFHVCACVDVRVCSGLCAYVYVCAAHMSKKEYGGQRTNLHVVPQMLSLWSLRKNLSLVWSSSSRQGWPASDLQGSTFLLLSSIGTASVCHHAQLFLKVYSEGQIQVFMLSRQELCQLRHIPSPWYVIEFVCKYLIMIFYMYVHHRDWSIILLFLCVSLLCLVSR